MSRAHFDALAAGLGRDLASPTRLRLLGVYFERGRLSPREATDLLGDVSLGSLSYHVRAMSADGLLKRSGERQVRGAIEHFYRLSALGERRYGEVLALLTLKRLQDESDNSPAARIARGLAPIRAPKRARKAATTS